MRGELTAFAADVRCGLTRTPQRELPSKYFYDDVGSALFEAITLLPEYGLTRADARLIEQHAAEIVHRMGPEFSVAELGSGSGVKTRRILEAAREPVRYFPIDVSRSALRACERELSPFADVEVMQATYLDGLREVASRRRGRLLVLFLGSTIGNFERETAVMFLAQVHSLLERGDALLLGADLEKSADVMIAAYDDSVGVTAAFNRNLLARINRELDANFNIAAFAHEARWNGDARRIEMHLRATSEQHVSAAGIKFLMRAGETIWTESSHKFSADEIEDLAPGFRSAAQWVDQEWPFVETLLIAD